MQTFLKYFNVGIGDDLIKLNNQIFSYLDRFLAAFENSPSDFQAEIHASSIPLEKFDLLLQNKIQDASFNYYESRIGQLMPVGSFAVKAREEIDETIKRLYIFNFYMSPQLVELLRGIHEKLYIYSFDMPAENKTGDIVTRPLVPSLSFMSEMLFSLQSDHAKLKNLVFKLDRKESSYIINLIMFLYHSKSYKKCIEKCSENLFGNLADKEFHLVFKALSMIALERLDEALKIVDYLLDGEIEVISYRFMFYPLLSNPYFCGLITKKVSASKIEMLINICEIEEKQKQEFLDRNMYLKNFFLDLRKAQQ